MEIGEVIRKYRKEKNMTQEYMAKRLGVTAPAVNKWERGKGQPDISLLVPVARLLGITLETLLSFNEELSNEEIAVIIKEIDQKFETESYNEVFIYASDIIKQYPDCYQLIWQIALIFDARLVSFAAKKILDREIYENQILEWYKQVIESDNINIQKEAAGSLFGYYVRKENYIEAEKYLKYFPEESAERNRKQAIIYSKTGHMEEAYKTYEQILFSEYHMLNLVMNSLYMLSMQENNIKLAGRWVDKQSRLAKLFDMGVYNEESCKLEPAVYKKDVMATLSIVKTLLNSSVSMLDYTKSFMYGHMEFKKPDPAFYIKLRDNLLEYFKDKETFGYMEGNGEWERLLRAK